MYFTCIHVYAREIHVYACEIHVYACEIHMYACEIHVHTILPLSTRCPKKNGALACCYSRANALFFVGHLEEGQISTLEFLFSSGLFVNIKIETLPNGCFYFLEHNWVSTVTFFTITIDTLQKSLLFFLILFFTYKFSPSSVSMYPNL